MWVVKLQVTKMWIKMNPLDMLISNATWMSELPRYWLSSTIKYQLRHLLRAFRSLWLAIDAWPSTSPLVFPFWRWPACLPRLSLLEWFETNLAALEWFSTAKNVSIVITRALHLITVIFVHRCLSITFKNCTYYQLFWIVDQYLYNCFVFVIE